MELASVIIAGLALLVAGFSALSSQRSAAAAQRAAAQDPWRLTREENHGWALINTSRVTAFDVTLAGEGDHPALRLVDVPREETIHAGALRRMSVGIGVWGSSPRVTVSWREKPGGKLIEWTTGL